MVSLIHPSLTNVELAFSFFFFRLSRQAPEWLMAPPIHKRRLKGQCVYFKKSVFSSLNKSAILIIWTKHSFHFTLMLFSGIRPKIRKKNIICCYLAILYNLLESIFFFSGQTLLAYCCPPFYLYRESIFDLRKDLFLTHIINAIKTLTRDWQLSPGQPLECWQEHAVPH